jgi:hypothetical protein
VFYGFPSPFKVEYNEHKGSNDNEQLIEVIIDDAPKDGDL